MKARSLVAGVLFLLITLATPFVEPADAKAQGWAVDPVHSAILFRIKHLNLGFVHGRFDEYSGTIQIDDEKPEASSVQLEVKATSVNTGAGEMIGTRDKHLRSPDFFNVAQFPTITFKSTAVKKVDAANYDVTGDFTLHGVTKSQTVRMEKIGEGKGPDGKQRIGFEGTFTVKRGEFGMNFMADKIGDEVRMTVAVEATKQ
jgi:polyisoprenoid-binding protein YceI